MKMRMVSRVPSMHSRSGGCRLVCALRAAWAVVILAGLLAPAAAQTQACGGNSTVDILGARTAASARAFLGKLKTAVRANDEEQIGSMIGYPLLVIHRSGTRSHIRGKKEFRAGYARIFTPAIREAILHQTAKCLFGNSSGAMIGDGQVWFREQDHPGEWKVITVNENAGRPSRGGDKDSAR